MQILWLIYLQHCHTIPAHPCIFTFLAKAFLISYSLFYRTEGLDFSLMFSSSSDLWMSSSFKIFHRHHTLVADPKGMYSWCIFEQLMHFTASQWERGFKSLSDFYFFCLIFSSFPQFILKWVVIFNSEQASKSKRGLKAESWGRSEREGIK